MLEGASGGWGFRVSGTGRTAKDVQTPADSLWNSGYHKVGGSGALGYRGSWGSLTGRTLPPSASSSPPSGPNVVPQRTSTATSAVRPGTSAVIVAVPPATPVTRP